MAESAIPYSNISIRTLCFIMRRKGNLLINLLLNRNINGYSFTSACNLSLCIGTHCNQPQVVTMSPKYQATHPLSLGTPCQFWKLFRRFEQLFEKIEVTQRRLDRMNFGIPPSSLPRSSFSQFQDLFKLFANYPILLEFWP